MHPPRTSIEDIDWLVEVSNAELAIDQLLAAKRRTMRSDPVREQVLWTRYHERLVAMKRKLDAVTM
jgi:hypothetical protein